MYPIGRSFIPVFGSHFIPDAVHPLHLTLLQTPRQAVCQEKKKAGGSVPYRQPEDFSVSAYPLQLFSAECFLFAFIPYNKSCVTGLIATLRL
jgi:hypothetical protein